MIEIPIHHPIFIAFESQMPQANLQRRNLG
jgi:hypothetical protein